MTTGCDTTSSVRDDRLSLLTRICFTPLAVVTAIFGPILVLFPGDTRDYWSWPIAPDMSAVWIGAGYSFGGIAITTMLVLGRASSSLVAIAGTWPFAIVMLAATLIHNDRFLTDSPGYYVWLAIYLVLPVALPVLLWQNLQHDPGPLPSDLRLPPALRWALVGAGAVAGLVGLVMVLDPGVLQPKWPWTLTPLMSRVVGGWLLFIGAGGLSALVETRWLAYRWYFVAAAVWFTVLLAGSVLNSDDFDTDRLATPLFFVAVVAAVVGLTGAWLLMERRVSREAKTPRT